MVVAADSLFSRRLLSRKAGKKLERLLLEAVANVPMYRELYEPLKLSPRDLADPQVLSRLPVLSKAHLLSTPPDERRNRRFRTADLSREATTGSTGQPMSLHIDRGYKVRRNLRFLRALLSVGYRPWHRLMLLTDRHRGQTKRQGWHYVPVEQPTAGLADAYLGIQPDVLYGFTTPLRLLASCLLERPDFPRPRLVVSTAEMLDSATRHALESAFRCPVADFYGMTEMGLVAWQRDAADGYVMFDDAVLTELLPDAGCRGRYRMVMTNLDLQASPIIRLDSGDFAYAEEIEGALTITAFEGRVIDALVCRDGSRLSPYRVTDALRDVPGVKQFKVTQRELTRFDIDLDVLPPARTEATNWTRSVLEGLLGPGLDLSFQFSENIIPAGSRKFRPVESLVGRT